ncbi:hypothetical protein KKG41_06780 [Patescibacteria group bacterium]|nr:hypothetical protein [Patescibacteria group bacterium]
MKSSSFLVVALWVALVFLPTTSFAGKEETHVSIEGADLHHCDMKARIRAIKDIPDHVPTMDGGKKTEEEIFSVWANNGNQVYETLRYYQQTEGTIWFLGYFMPHGKRTSEFHWPNEQTVCYQLVDSAGADTTIVCSDKLIVTFGNDLTLGGPVIYLNRGFGGTFYDVAIDDTVNDLGIRYTFWVGFSPFNIDSRCWDMSNFVRAFIGRPEDALAWTEQTSVVDHTADE